ncbi:MAG: TauD/TfdA dioxygenase family protein [Alphaproteobacteria bacterium]|jgi:alpha-ketoglutarate-dependent 2,4-dichlorophenoxyacetate dioxygenase
MSIQIRELMPGFVGEVIGADLSKPLAQDDVLAIDQGMDRLAVLVFHGQNITDEQQLEFSLNFGAIERPDRKSNITQDKDRRIRADMADISNLNKEHQPLGRNDRQRLFNLGNQLWHSDSSFRATPAKYSLLSGRICPSQGGNTEFADMRAAYDALDLQTKEKIEEIVCEHSLLFSRGSLGFDDDLTEEEKQGFAPVRQSLVRVHPKSGRKSLYLSAHAGRIVGWPTPEARIFLRDLNEHATQSQFVYAHKWRAGDLVMWDNRQTMHRARPFEDTSEVRDMRRTTIAGEAMTARQVAAA